MRLSFRHILCVVLLGSVNAQDSTEDLILLEDMHQEISQNYNNLSSHTMFLYPNASLTIQGDLSNSGTIHLESGASINVNGSFTHTGTGKMEFFGTSNHQFGFLSAESITLDSSSSIVLNPRMVLFGEYEYTLLSSTTNPIIDNGVSIELETSSYTPYIALTHGLSDDRKSMFVSFELTETAKNTDLSTLNSATFATLSSYNQALLSYLKNHNQAFGVGVVSAFLSDKSSQNVAELTQALYKTQNETYDQALYDAMNMSWIGSNAQVALRLNQRADTSQSSDADIWVDLSVGASSFGTRMQNLFGFHGGVDKRFGDHVVLGVALGYMRGASEITQAFNYNAQYLFTNLYGRIFDTHHELDMSMYGMVHFSQMSRHFGLWGFDSVQQSAYNPHALGAKVSYGYVFHLSHAPKPMYFIKPVVGFNAYYSHQPTFKESGTLPVHTSAVDLFYQTLEFGMEYRFKGVGGNYLYIRPSYEALVSFSQNTAYTQIVDSALPIAQNAFVLPRGFVNLVVGGEIAYKENLHFSLNASYKQAMDAQDGYRNAVRMNMVSFWGGARFGF